MRTFENMRKLRNDKIILFTFSLLLFSNFHNKTWLYQGEDSPMQFLFLFFIMLQC